VAKVRKDVRKLFRLGNSYAIILPKEYVEAKGLKEGDLVEVIFDDWIHVAPLNEEELAQRAEKAREALRT